jgi:hypothetical protein
VQLAWAAGDSSTYIMMDVFYNQPPCDWNSPELTCHLSHAYTARHPAPASRSVCTLNKYNSALKYLMIVCFTPLLTYLFSTGQSQSITTCTTSSPAHCADSVVWLLLPIQNVLPDVIDFSWHVEIAQTPLKTR